MATTRDKTGDRLRLVSVDPEETLACLDNDVIASLYPVDRHAGGGVDVRLRHNGSCRTFGDRDAAHRYIRAVVTARADYS